MPYVDNHTQYIKVSRARSNPRANYRKIIKYSFSKNICEYLVYCKFKEITLSHTKN